MHIILPGISLAASFVSAWFTLSLPKGRLVSGSHRPVQLCIAGFAIILPKISLAVSSRRRRDPTGHGQQITHGILQKGMPKPFPLILLHHCTSLPTLNRNDPKLPKLIVRNITVSITAQQQIS
jgi:hypothetical protein